MTGTPRPATSSPGSLSRPRWQNLTGRQLQGSLGPWGADLQHPCLRAESRAGDPGLPYRRCLIRQILRGVKGDVGVTRGPPAVEAKEPG